MKAPYTDPSLYAPAEVEAMIRAALEGAAGYHDQCAKAYAHDLVWHEERAHRRYAAAIRALDPKQFMERKE